jgi:hypothetical protein
MKIMWVDEQVEATVEFPRGLAFPRLRAIRYRDRCVRFAGPIRSERTSTALLYRGHAEGSEYSVRYETASQRWILEAVRDAPRTS